MKRVGPRIGVEDDRGPRWIGRRLEGVEVAEVEPLVAERRPEAEAGKMVGHPLSPLASKKTRRTALCQEIAPSRGTASALVRQRHGNSDRDRLERGIAVRGGLRRSLWKRLGE